MSQNASSPFRYIVAAAILLLITGASFAQVTKTQTPAEKQKSMLLGKWKSDEAVIEFRADNTITINDEEFSFKMRNAVITVTGDDGSMAFPYSLDGDTLTVDVQGGEVIYTRVKGAGRRQGSGSGSGAEDGTGIMQALVGKWCYMSNLTGSNSRMSNRCFTLSANGTYEYSSETSSSGAYGGSASQEFDSGRWSATQTTLTAISNTNGKIVYPIQLRNHPKTGDPMIVVDGDAYVTAYQKRPW